MEITKMMFIGQLFMWLSVPVLNETVFCLSWNQLTFCTYTVFALRGRLVHWNLYQSISKLIISLVLADWWESCSLFAKCMSLINFEALHCLAWHLSHLMTKPTKWLCAQRRLRSACASTQSVDSEDWSDWAHAQADLSLRWEHVPFCWFCHEVAHFTEL